MRPGSQQDESTRPAEVLETGWTADTSAGDSILRRFVLNQSDLQVQLAEAVGGPVRRTPDILLSAGQTPVVYLNLAVLQRPVLTADDPVLDEAESFYSDAGVPGLLLSVWPTPDLAPRGWTLVGHPMFVVRPPGPVTGLLAGLAPGVEISKATSTTDLELAERLCVAGYPIPEAEGLPPLAMLGAGLLDSGVTVRIARHEGLPVATASQFIGHGLVNLCMAATLPTARRLGAWRRLVAERVADAPELPAVAFTSDDSRPGFIRLGFLPLLRFTLWAR